MAKFTLRLPDQLYERAREELPADVSWSALLADALKGKLAETTGCEHSTVKCTSCGVVIEPTAPAEPTEPASA